MACSFLSLKAETSIEVEGNDDSGDFYLVQVRTGNGKKWQSSGLHLHDEIPIVPLDDNDQSWYLERDDNSPLWTFHTKSPEGIKLYVTYNKEKLCDQKVSLEYDRSGNNTSSRNFVLFLQPDGRYAIATPSSLQRLLCANDEVLVLTDEEHPTTNQDWIISNDRKVTSGQSTKSYVQVLEQKNPASKWISTNARNNDRVHVSPSRNEEKWIVSGTVSGMTFQVPTQDCYASKTDESEVEILFESNSANANLRKFKIVSNKRIPQPGVLLQTVSDDWYVGTQESLLQLKERDICATGWYLEATNMVFPKLGGKKEDIFPAFKVSHPAPNH